MSNKSKLTQAVTALVTAQYSVSQSRRDVANLEEGHRKAVRDLQREQEEARKQLDNKLFAEMVAATNQVNESLTDQDKAKVTLSGLMASRYPNGHRCVIPIDNSMMLVTYAADSGITTVEPVPVEG